MGSFFMAFDERVVCESKCMEVCVKIVLTFNDSWKRRSNISIYNRIRLYI